MARIGLLMLRGGDWNGQQVISKEWVRRITNLVTPFHEMNPPYQRSLGNPWRWGYGYMWWVWDAPNSQGPFVGAYTGMGAGGQFITVLPQADMVIAHKVDMQQPLPLADAKRTRNVTGGQYNAIVAMLYACYCGSNCP
jgi:CubicO group peptidase (beta-lactamase class C family)